MSDEVRVSPAPRAAPPCSVSDLARHRRWLHRLAVALVRDVDVAADLVQETLIAGFRRPPVADDVRPWLRGVLLRISSKRFRGESRRARRELAVATDELDPGPHERFETKELRVLLLAAIDELPEDVRSALLLRYDAGLTAAEIAQRQGMPASTVRSRIQAGLAHVRHRLRTRYGDDGWRRALVPLGALAAPRGASLATYGCSAAAALLVLALIGGPAALDARGSGLRGEPSVRGSGPAARAPSVAPAATVPTPRQDEAGTNGADDGISAGAPGATLTPPRLADRHGGQIPCGLPTDAATAPRLLITPERLCRIRAALATPGSTLGEIFALLRARVDAGRPELFSTDRLNYARAYQAQAAAFVYLVTGDTRYARAAFTAIQSMYVDPGDEWLPDRGPSIGRAKTGVPLAFVHDWARAGLTEVERASLRAHLGSSVAAWAKRDGSDRWDRGASSIAAAAGSAQVLQLLALGAERERAARLETLVRRLEDHVAAAYGTLGASQEGYSYAAAGGLFLLPAAHALAARGDARLHAKLATRAFWKALMYVADSAGVDPTIPPALGSRLPGIGAEDAGWASLLVPLIPAHALPEYKHFYDRYLGALSPRAPERRYDPERGGHVWALLYYPEDSPSRDATGRFPAAVADDTRGVYHVRSGWSGEGDLRVTLAGDFAAVENAHDAAEALDLSVHLPATPRPMALTLTVDGVAPEAPFAVGARGSFQTRDRAAYAVVGGGSRYGSRAVSVERHLAVDLGDDRATVLATLDRVHADRPRVFGWRVDAGGDASAAPPWYGTEAGRPTFVVHGAGGSFLKAWVLHPADASLVRDGQRLTVAVQAASADVVVAMAAARGTPPVATVRGEGLDAELVVGGTSVRLDRAQGQLVIARTASALAARR